MGDFNSIINAEETLRPDKVDQRICRGFINWIFEHELIDLGYTRSKYTWTIGVSATSFKGLRLDELFVTWTGV